jgi:hypothetical protein
LLADFARVYELRYGLDFNPRLFFRRGSVERRKHRIGCAKIYAYYVPSIQNALLFMTLDKKYKPRIAKRAVTVSRLRPGQSQRGQRLRRAAAGLRPSLATPCV